MATNVKVKRKLTEKKSLSGWSPGKDEDSLMMRTTLRLGSPQKSTTAGRAGTSSRRDAPKTSKGSDKKKEHDGDGSIDSLDDWGDPGGTQLVASKNNMAAKNKTTFGGQRRILYPQKSESESESEASTSKSESEVSEPPRRNGQKKRTDPKTRTASSPQRSTRGLSTRSKDDEPKAKPPEARGPAAAPFPMPEPGRVRPAPPPSIPGRKQVAAPFPVSSTPPKKRTAEAAPFSSSSDVEVVPDGDRRPQPAPFPMTDTQMHIEPEPSDSRRRSESFFAHRAQQDDASSDDVQEIEDSTSSKPNSSASSGQYSSAERDRRKPVGRRDTKKLSTSPERRPCKHNRAGPSSPFKTPVSPSKLCPYCDEPLPPNPSATVKKLLKSLLSISDPAPRPSNPYGRDAPLHVSIALCSVHRAESTTIPAGLKRGWPDNVDFDAVSRRLRGPKFRERLFKLLHTREERNSFWDDACKDVKKHGVRAANSLQGQMETFESIQPGYYGERGVVIISEAMQEMFPVEDIDPRLTAPLAPADFVRRVLLPSAAAFLIKRDMDSSFDGARQIMKDSWSFGVALYPAKDGDGDTSIRDISMTPTPKKPSKKGKERAPPPPKALARTHSARDEDEIRSSSHASSSSNTSRPKRLPKSATTSEADVEEVLAVDSDGTPQKPKRKDGTTARGKLTRGSRLEATRDVFDDGGTKASTKRGVGPTMAKIVPTFTSLGDDDQGRGSPRGKKSTKGKPGRKPGALPDVGSLHMEEDDDDSMDLDEGNLFAGPTGKQPPPAKSKSKMPSSTARLPKIGADTASKPSHQPQSSPSKRIPNGDIVEVVVNRINPPKFVPVPSASTAKPGKAQKRKADTDQLDYQPLEFREEKKPLQTTSNKRTKKPVLLGSALLDTLIKEEKQKEAPRW